MLFGSIVIIAIVSVALAVALPKNSTEDRSKAASAGVCIAQATVAGSACNEKCGADEDCMGETVCYMTSGATEGVCRNPSNPTNTSCGSTTTTPTPIASTPTPTPIAACTKACTYNYDCNLSAGETCVGTNANNPSVNISVTGSRAATSAELSGLASDQVIFMGPGNDYKPDASGKMPFSVISKKATTFVVYVFDITATKGNLDPQKLILTKSFPIGANQVVTGTVTLPRCGRYQVDYGSTIVTGTKYDVNTAAHYFWGTVFEIPCQSGCCQAATSAGAATTAVASKADLVRLSLVNPTTGIGLTGYTGLSTSTTVNASSIPAYSVAAVSFPNNFPTGVGSVKFEANGQLVRIDNTEPYAASDSALSLPSGTYTIKATMYSLENATGTVVDTLSTTLTVTGASTATATPMPIAPGTTCNFTAGCTCTDSGRLMQNTWTCP